MGLNAGWNQRWAISVGTTALPITAVTRIVYCCWSMMWFVRPNRAEIVPKVRPVDISSVVYMPSRGSKRKAPRQRQDADELGHHLDREIDDDGPRRGDHGLKLHKRAGLEEVEWSEDREGDDAHAVWQFEIGQKIPGASAIPTR